MAQVHGPADCCHSHLHYPRFIPQVTESHRNAHTATTPNIIESKSFKLYLNSFAQTRFDAHDDVVQTLVTDLTHAAGGPVSVELVHASQFPGQAISELQGVSIDDSDILLSHYGPPTPHVLQSTDDVASESLTTNLLRSNCPVTGQPDWGSVLVVYTGPRIDRDSLLRYIVSYRTHTDFHEQCVERIFTDIMAQCKPTVLTVYARYTRRGGLDINPYRSTTDNSVPSNIRTARQ